jgi:NhaC family Na+:H+ antiporter
MEWLVLGLFCAGLVACLLADWSILYALAAGLLLFLLYGRRKGFGWAELFKMALSGVKTVRNILITFLLIGVLTAFWRSAGTIPVIVCHAARLIRPGVFLLMTFLLNAGVSVLTGTSFGTAATMGVITAAMGRVMGIPVTLTGGAVLSGVFFGDRCSPVSTSALLVATLTDTDIFDNIRRMIRTALAPFLISCAIYALLGFLCPHSRGVMDLAALFSGEFSLSLWAVVPAAVILLLSLLRVNVKLAMAASILSAVPLCLWLQGRTPAELLQTALTGFTAMDADVAAMLNGGGVTSMLRVAAIVCLSSSYSVLFQKTGLLDRVRGAIRRLADRTSPFLAMLCTSILAGMVACNQSLTILLVHQLCLELHVNASDMALDLEDTAVVTAPLVPWSIAGAVPLSAVGAPGVSVLLACYLYLLPTWRLCSRRRAR